MNENLYRRRKFVNKLGLFASFIAMVLGLFVLLWILFILFKNGFAGLSLTIFTESTPAPGTPGGGLANAIVGSLMMVGVSVLISTPIGIQIGRAHV
jgi:phosphate transport system permease protein